MDYALTFTVVRTILLYGVLYLSVFPCTDRAVATRLTIYTLTHKCQSYPEMPAMIKLCAI